MKNKLKITLFLGAFYFYIVAFLHFFGIKIPPFFIYYDVDSTIYQDRIIAVLSFMFATFLYAGYRLKTKEIVAYILFAGIIGVFGLAINNYFTNNLFKTNIIYWSEIGFLAVYVSILAFFYNKSV